MGDARQAFQWIGINRHGQRVKGVLTVHDNKELESELRKQEIQLISAKSVRQGNITVRKHKVKQKNILIFTRNLATMMAAGLPIMQSLDLIAQDQDNAAMQSFVIALKKNVSGGKTLAESFEQYPNYFNQLYCSLIKTGEKSGSLDIILNRLGSYLERSELLRKKVKKALIYPSAIIVVAIVVSSIMLMFVVPKFKTLFDSFNAKLPFFTRVVIGISEFLQSYWWLIALIIFGIVMGVKYLLKHSPDFRYRFDKMLMRIYVIGPILRKGIISRFARTLGTTLESGMPITEAMESMAPIMGNAVYSEAILKITHDIVNGHQLNVAMGNTDLFPNMMVQMIAVGEASGSLVHMLNKVADYYEEEVNFAVDNLSSLLEPLIMVVLGTIIGGLVIAMYLPIFKLGSLF